jgi:CRP-like cAMP-binding protein
MSVEQSSAPLEQCLLLQSLSTDELEVVVERLQFEDFAQGAEILTEGLSYHGLWILLDGRCEVLRGGRQGSKPSQLAVIEPGAVFGEMSFLTGHPHSATVRALTSVKTARMMKSSFVELEAARPAIAERIMTCVARVMADRLRKMDEWICQLVEKGNHNSHQGEWREFRSKLYADWQM